MTAHTWNAMLSRSALLALAATGLVACGPREPSTDAERLARGRELVQQMSARLASANERECDHHRNARRRAAVGARKSRCPAPASTSCDAPITSTPSRRAAEASKPGTTGKC